MTDWEIDEAEFGEWMLSEWFYKLVDELNVASACQQELTKRGGVPGQVNVMLNGKCITFPDAIPEIISERTMVPLRFFLSYCHSGGYKADC